MKYIPSFLVCNNFLPDKRLYTPCLWLPSDVSDLLKFLRPLHEGTLVFVASFDDPATK